MELVIAGLSEGDLDGQESSLMGFVATELGVDASRVMILGVTSTTTRRRLSDSVSLSFIISGYTTYVAAPGASSELEDYVNSSDGLLSEIQNTSFGAGATGISLESISTEEGGEDTRSSYPFSCSLDGSEETVLFWDVSDVGSSVSALLYHTGSAVSDKWIAVGLVGDDVDTMVASSGIDANKVFMYRPSVPSADMYEIASYGSSGFAVDSATRSDGITGIDLVESSESHVSMAFTYSDNTGVASDTTLRVGAGKSNRIMWATGSGSWPSSHSNGNYGFKRIYWHDGRCEEPVVKVPMGAIIFIPLLLVFLLSSRLSPLRVWGDLKKGMDPHSRDSVLESLLLVRLWCRWRVGRVDPNTISCCVGDNLASLIGSQPSLAGEYSILGQCGLILFYVLNFIFILTWGTAGTAGAASWSRAFGVTALMNFWLALLPTAKSSLILYVTSVPYERAVKYHRIVTSLGVFLTTLHIIVNIVNVPVSTLLGKDPYGMHEIYPMAGSSCFRRDPCDVLVGF